MYALQDGSLISSIDVGRVLRRQQATCNDKTWVRQNGMHEFSARRGRWFLKFCFDSGMLLSATFSQDRVCFRVVHADPTYNPKGSVASDRPSSRASTVPSRPSSRRGGGNTRVRLGGYTQHVTWESLRRRVRSRISRQWRIQQCA